MTFIQQIKRILASFLFVTVIFSAYSQNYRFAIYDLEDRLPNKSIYTIIQDDKGYLWFGTGEGLSRYNGFEFLTGELGDTLNEGVVYTSYKDRSGHLWFGHNDGSISMYDGEKIEIIQVPDISNGIFDITEDARGNVLLATQNQGIIKIFKDQAYVSEMLEVQTPFISSLHFLSEDKLLLGTFSGLFLYSYHTNKAPELIKQIEEIPSTKIECIVPGKNFEGFWVGTEDEGFYKIETGDGGTNFSITNIGEKYHLEYENVKDMIEDEEGNLWLGTSGNGVYKLELTGDNQYQGPVRYFSNEENIKYVQSIFQDYEGNIWIGTQGAGLARLINESFAFYQFQEYGFSTGVHALLVDEDVFWIGGEDGILKISRDFSGEHTLYTQKDGLPNDRVTSLYKDVKGRLWIGTSRSGIYHLTQGRITRYFSAVSNIGNFITHIDGTKDYVWVSTRDGVFSFNLETNERKHYTTRDGVPHNNINQVYLNNEKVFIATKTKYLSVIENGKHKWSEVEGLNGNEFTALTLDDEGYLWGATYGSGVFLFKNDSAFHLSTENGLIKDYCYSLLNDHRGHIWVGHRTGLSRIDIDSLTIKTFGQEIGIEGDCNPHAIVMDDRGIIYFGTTNGMIKYDYRKDKTIEKSLPTSFTEIRINNERVATKNKIELGYGSYDIEIEYIGISYANTDQVRYQYKLENYDEEWSEVTDSRKALYRKISHGNYTFLLRSVNSDGVSLENPLECKIIIRAPFWKKWWFILTTIGVILALFIFIVKVRERNHRRLQEYLKRRLDERTREVVQQKEVIELKNKDITDSINYAQRIQASILPPKKRLDEHFSESFIYYVPRDIVSGDFYWFDKIDDDRFVIVCADSTGHGVPGAFMSMIGTTLIKDIFNRQHFETPSQMLELLDNEISSTLNQNLDTEKSQDGMDLTICEINLKNNHLRVASAMRPIILYKNGEQLYIRGNRSSVGGQITEEKVFEDQEYVLNPGDVIYMFSDGYPDQFGGPMGKKFKMVRLKNLMNDIHDKSMEEQYEYVKNTFELWKNGLDQVDDVLFMGIKI